MNPCMYMYVLKRQYEVPVLVNDYSSTQILKHTDTTPYTTSAPFVASGSSNNPLLYTHTKHSQPYLFPSEHQVAVLTHHYISTQKHSQPHLFL